jgi:hypothetical protein
MTIHAAIADTAEAQLGPGMNQDPLSQPMPELK